MAAITGFYCCCFSLAILLVALLVGLVVNNSDSSTDINLSDFKVIKQSSTIEKYLTQYKTLIGNDYNGYRGHIYRVFSYTMHFLKTEDKSLVKKHIESIEIALVFHDIGLWTDSTLAYLEPSIERVSQLIKKEKKTNLDLDLINDIILYHHKITVFNDKTKSKIHNSIVEATRKSDWIDASQGFIRKGMPKLFIEKAFNNIPVNGFYDTLIEFGPRLHGYNIFKMLNILKILRF